jgi:mannosyl-oligosaccharide glucosidase
MIPYKKLAALLAFSSTAFTVHADTLAEFEKYNNDSLLWGPYRPNVYLGVRPRIPDGPLMGLMWGRVEDYHSLQSGMDLVQKSQRIF